MFLGFSIVFLSREPRATASQINFAYTNGVPLWNDLPCTTVTFMSMQQY